MNLIEFIFFAIALVLASSGAIYFSHYGLVPAILGGILGFITPFVLSQIVVWIDEIRYSRTTPGKNRKLAENIFDRNHPDRRRITSWRCRPVKTKNGNFVYTIYYGKTRPPFRSFFKFSLESEPIEISEEEASTLIRVYPLR
jgi:hypothetical protein